MLHVSRDVGAGSAEGQVGCRWVRGLFILLPGICGSNMAQSKARKLIYRFRRSTYQLIQPHVPRSMVWQGFTLNVHALYDLEAGAGFFPKPPNLELWTSHGISSPGDLLNYSQSFLRFCYLIEQMPLKLRSCPFALVPPFRSKDFAVQSCLRYRFRCSLWAPFDPSFNLPETWAQPE